MELPIEISSLISTISKKDPTSLGISISTLGEKEMKDLLSCLQAIEKKTTEKKKKKNEKVENERVKKEETDRRFLQRLRTKVESNSRVDVVIPTQFFNLEELLKPLEEDNQLEDKVIFDLFKGLQNLVEDLDIIKCLANFAEGRIVLHLQSKNNWTLVKIANELKIGVSFTERLSNFAKFCSEYPALLLTGYSMETILKKKTLIERACDEDENFKSLLETEPGKRFYTEPVRMESVEEESLLSNSIEKIKV